jgi:hypothetical protein
MREGIPPLLTSLQASMHVNSQGRHCSRRPASYSVMLDVEGSCSSLWLLKKALLLVESALPHGALDKSDDKWGKKQFGPAWRESVMSATDPTGLMQCLLLLEYSIKPQWLKPAGLKLFALLPSRSFSMRQATAGMVAMRLWTLDQTIKYERVEKESARKVTPPGMTPSVTMLKMNRGSSDQWDTYEEEDLTEEKGRRKVAKRRKLN